MASGTSNSLCATIAMPSGASMARSSASLPALLEASTQVSGMGGVQRIALQLQQFGNALVGVAEQCVQFRAAEGVAFRRALDFHETAGFVHDHVHVRDRKSTRLNSSHVSISYAVFCLKKK